MYFDESERIGIIVDGITIYGTAKALDIDIDFGRVRKFAEDRGRFIRAEYYTPVPSASSSDFSPTRPLVDWLRYNGWHPVTPIGREVTDHATGRRILKSVVNAEIGVGIIRMGRIVDHILLFSNKPDCAPPIRLVQEAGVRVTVIGTLQGSTVQVSDDLRAAADDFIEIDDIRQDIARDQMDARPSRAARDLRASALSELEGSQ